MHTAPPPRVRASHTLVLPLTSHRSPTAQMIDCILKVQKGTDSVVTVQLLRFRAGTKNSAERPRSKVSFVRREMSDVEVLESELLLVVWECICFYFMETICFEARSTRGENCV